MLLKNMLIEDVKLDEFKYGEEEGEIHIKDVLNFINRHKSERVPLLRENEMFLLQGKSSIVKYFENEIASGDFNGVIMQNNLSNIICQTQYSYLMGNGISYTSKQDDYKSLEAFVEIRNESEGDDVEKEIVEGMGEYGVAYELVYLNNSGEPRYIKLDPFQTFVIYDYSIQMLPLYGVRYYEDYKGMLVIEIYGKNFFRKYVQTEDKKFVIKERKENIFNIVNIVEYRNNKNMLCDFQFVKTYLLGIDHTLITQGGLVEYLNKPITVFENVDITVEDFKKIKESGGLSINNTESMESKVYFLDKLYDTESLRYHLDTLYRNAFKESFTPMLSVEDLMKAPSGKALEFMYFNTETVVNSKIKYITRGINQRLRVIFNMLNFTKLSEDYGYKTIRPIFSRNLPTLTTSDLEDLVLLRSSGIELSHRTLLENLPSKLVPDIDEELSRLEAERDGSIDFVDFINREIEKIEENREESEEERGV